MIYTNHTGALNTNAAIKPSGTAKHHIAPILPFISNLASPPALTPLITHCTMLFTIPAMNKLRINYICPARETADNDA
jgi:hypothetical protein